MDIKNLLEERNIELKYVDKNYDFHELKSNIIITNDDNFTKNLLSNIGFTEFCAVKKASVENVERIKKSIKENKSVVGFGGGVAIDTAKKVSCDLNLDLISIPTAPSHDGLTSRNSSLYENGIKKTIPTKYPEKLVIPLYLWENSGKLKKAGICDLISNLIALQDISLAEKKRYEFSEYYKRLSLEAYNRINNDEKKLSEGLILSSIAMEETSTYGSGSEHEVEKLFEKNGFRYLHGQLAGTGVLISAKVYSIYHKNLPELEYDSRSLFETIKNKMRNEGVYEFALQPLYDEKFNPRILKRVGEIRPERFNLWNVINSRKVDWEFVVNEILKD
jgi:glycerol-1-phosphate dehydrogenase [NAD(P)+]